MGCLSWGPNSLFCFFALMSSNIIRVGGVPEHFNLPWHLAKETGLFAKHNVDVQWTDVPNGTGAMVNIK